MKKLELELEVKKAEASKSIQVVHSSFDVGKTLRWFPYFVNVM